MRNLLLTALALITAVLPCAHTRAQAPANALADRLQRVSASSSLDTPAHQPWHLKLEVQLFDARGHAAGVETLEEWWSDQHHDKRVYTGAYSVIELHTPDGIYRNSSSGDYPDTLDQMRDAVVHPVSEVDLKEASPTLHAQKFGKNEFDCLMLERDIPDRKPLPFGIFPTYCLDKATDTLRVSYQFGFDALVRNHLGKFQGADVAVDAELSRNGTIAAKSHIVTLESAPLTDADFVPDANMRRSSIDPFARISSGITSGLKIGGSPPVYPSSARANHITGGVVLNALIGTDGRIRSLRVIKAPDPDLALAALAAVRTWRYRPYLVKGEPISVDTTIVVNFNLAY